MELALCLVSNDEIVREVSKQTLGDFYSQSTDTYFIYL